MKKFLIATALLLPQLVLAQPPQPGVDPCAGIGGCQTNGVTIIGTVVQNTAAIFVGIAAGASILFVVVGGFQMLMSFGNETLVTKGRHSVLFALGGLALALGAQAIVSFVVNSAVAGGLPAADANPALALMRVAVAIMMGVFNTIFLVVAVGAGLRMVLGHGQSEQFSKARSTLIFSIVGAVVVNVARALVNIILAAGF